MVYFLLQKELLFLWERVFYVQKKNPENAEPSHVLTACNANLEEYSPIRISLGKDNTEEEIEYFVKTLINVVGMLRRKE